MFLFLGQLKGRVFLNLHRSLPLIAVQSFGNQFSRSSVRVCVFLFFSRRGWFVAYFLVTQSKSLVILLLVTSLLYNTYK